LGFTNWLVILLHQLGPIKFSGTIITAPSTRWVAQAETAHQLHMAKECVEGAPAVVFANASVMSTS
jgi:hypothetical protein